jgi:hypothetical protein
MARIDLRNCTIYLKDGLAGTAASAKKTNEKQTITVTDASGGTFTVTYATVESGNLPYNITPAQLQSALEGLTSIGEGNILVTGTAGVTYLCEFTGTLGEASLGMMVIDDTNVTGGAGVEVTIAQTLDGGTGVAPSSGNTSLTIASVVLNTLDTDLVPIGARFTLAGEAAATTHVVTARTPDTTPATSPTTAITFTPALGAASSSYSTGAVLTFAPNQVEITIGDGDLKYTEADQYKYDLDRGELDTVRRGDDQPMEITTNFTFDQVASGTGEAITPIEALKGTGAASEWVTSSTDLCEPYAVDVVVEDVRPCGGAASSTYTFPDFRSEKRDFDLKNATIAVSGKCNALEPTIVRGA